MISLQVADWVAEYFRVNGVDKVFLYPGGTIAPLINACIAQNIKIEIFKGEQGALYAALAYARVTGRPQVAMVTSGPGVTNAITPLADAFYDSTPLVLIAGQIGTTDLTVRKPIRQRGFQEVPTVEITSPITKRSKCVFTVDAVFREIPLALQLSQSGRAGPVVIDFPMDIQRSEIIQFPSVERSMITTEDHAVSSEDDDTVSQIAAAASASLRPVVLLGHGALVAGKFESYKNIAKLIDARVVSSLLGLGSYDATDGRYLGYIGHTGHIAANRAVHECDFLLALGTRLDVRQTGTLTEKFVANGRVAWVNLDGDELANPRVQVEWKVQRDVGSFCQAFIDKFPLRIHDSDENWIASLTELQLESLEDSPIPGSNALQPRTVLQILAGIMKRKSSWTVVTGVGCHQQWAARHLPYHPNNCRFLTSGGHGTMGYDLPSAVGAAMAETNRNVVCIVGDGSFLMNIQEMAALKERDLNVKILVLNNRRLGIVSQFQLITWGSDPTTGIFGAPDFVTISRGFGIPARRLESSSDIEVGLEWLLAQKGPALAEILIDPAADVIPMLLSGQAMDEMWMGRNST